MNKQITLKFIFKPLISCVITALFIFNSQILNASDEKDLILVLDTSLSMIGHGGRNILPSVKRSLPRYINQLKEDDSVTFITFDTKVNIYPTVYIDDEKNKESLVEYVNNIKAKGKWTYTKEMINSVLKKAQELEKKDKDRQRIIVVMTDALDDPPPGQRKHRLNIKEIANNYKDKDWFIFFINFGEVAKNTKLAKIQNQLKKSVSEYINVIEAKENPGKGIEEDLSQNIDNMTAKKIEKEGSFSFFPFLVVLLIIGITLGLIYYFKNYANLKVTGKLEYWEHSLLSPYYENFDMTRLNLKEVRIGSNNTDNLTIREIEINEPFKIFAIKDNKDIKIDIVAEKGSNIEYINRESTGYLKNGDMFKVANFTFKYTT